jgi:hypothetical protein
MNEIFRPIVENIRVRLHLFLITGYLLSYLRLPPSNSCVKGVSISISRGIWKEWKFAFYSRLQICHRKKIDRRNILQLPLPLLQHRSRGNRYAFRIRAAQLPSESFGGDDLAKLLWYALFSRAKLLFPTLDNLISQLFSCFVIISRSQLDQ